MSDTPMKLVVSNGKEEYLPLTEEELQQREVDAQAFAVAQAEREAAEQALAELKASAKAKLVAGEPLTEEEAAAIVL